MVSHPKDPSEPPAPGQPPASPGRADGERIARVLARAGVASRREAERMIEAGRVALNGQVLTSPAVNVGRGDIVTLDGAPIADRPPARLWRYHKPPGLITTHRDPRGRPTVFERLPRELGRVISVGRLDLNSEGLLLLTNDGDLARRLELPSSGLMRRYRARAFGRITQDRLDRLMDGVVVEGVAYGPIEAELERGSGANVWIRLGLSEGKNREVRRVLEHLGLKVNRLIRVSYGPFTLGELAAGEVSEVPSGTVRRLMKGEFDIAPPAERPGRPAKAAASRPRPKPAPRDAAARIPKAPARKPARTTAAAAAAEEKPKSYKPGWARPRRPQRPGAGRPSAGGGKRR